MGSMSAMNGLYKMWTWEKSHVSVKTLSVMVLPVNNLVWFPTHLFPPTNVMLQPLSVQMRWAAGVFCALWFHRKPCRKKKKKKVSFTLLLSGTMPTFTAEPSVCSELSFTGHGGNWKWPAKAKRKVMKPFAPWCHHQCFPPYCSWTEQMSNYCHCVLWGTFYLEMSDNLTAWA